MDCVVVRKNQQGDVEFDAGGQKFTLSLGKSFDAFPGDVFELKAKRRARPEVKTFKEKVVEKVEKVKDSFGA